MEKSLKNVIMMTVEAGIMLLFGIIITFFDAAVEISDADIQWGWAICGVAVIILIAGIAACIVLSKIINTLKIDANELFWDTDTHTSESQQLDNQIALYAKQLSIDKKHIVLNLMDDLKNLN